MGANNKDCARLANSRILRLVALLRTGFVTGFGTIAQGNYKNQQYSSMKITQNVVVILSSSSLSLKRDDLSTNLGTPKPSPPWPRYFTNLVGSISRNTKLLSVDGLSANW